MHNRVLLLIILELICSVFCYYVSQIRPASFVLYGTLPCKFSKTHKHDVQEAEILE